ncbi:hypothetical protein QUW02_01230 [Bacteroides eggerthii]|uniref:Transmembrane protein n=1 Tax=Bacteroides eggerthii TaxID=28111 RepID=A0ABT7U256_9BACE|nr:hypothetical protein [Bacteroides eggerthii]
MDKMTLNLRVNFCSWLIVALAVVVLFETETCMPGVWIGTEMSEAFFFLLTATQLLTLCAIPVALKLLNWKSIRQQVTVPDQKGAQAYLRWNIVRCAILGGCLVLNLMVYYCTLEKANALCALILLFSYSFCWPSDAKRKAETDAIEME